MKNSKRYLIRDYRNGDEHGITNLFKEVFKKEMTLRQWHWKYFTPGNGRIYSKVVEDSSQKIIAHAGAIPLRGIFKNKSIQFFQIVDVMVHEKARGYLGKKNLFNIMIKALFEDIGKNFSNVFCYGFPGSRPFILGEREGVYEKIEKAHDLIKQTKSSFFIPYKIKSLHWMDDKIDYLWSLLSEKFPLTIIRDKDYLQWRYASNPFFTYHLLGFFLLKKLKGWVVIRDSRDEILVVDLLAEERHFTSIMKTLESFLISRGKKTIRLWLPEKYKRYLKRYNIQETPVVVTNMVWKLPVQTSIVKEGLYYTMGDADIF